MSDEKHPTIVPTPAVSEDPPPGGPQDGSDDPFGQLAIRLVADESVHRPGEELLWAAEGEILGGLWSGR